MTENAFAATIDNDAEAYIQRHENTVQFSTDSDDDDDLEVQYH